jgi:hypothetical protein
MSSNLIFRDINGADISNENIIEKMNMYKSKGNRKIEEKVIKEQLKCGFIRFVNNDGEWCDADIADVKGLVELLKNSNKSETKTKKVKEVKTENKEKTKTEKKQLDCVGGEESGSWRANLNVDYSSFINNMCLKWDDIIWEKDGENDMRNYSILCRVNDTEWTIYDWDTKNCKNKWFISGKGTDKELQDVINSIEKHLLVKHPKEPGTITSIENFAEMSLEPKKKDPKKLANSEINNGIKSLDLSEFELDIDEYEIED